MSVTTVSSKKVQQLKQSARNLKRDQAIHHTEALELVAREAGFKNWHQITKANSLVLPAELALKSGCIIAIDIKDGLKHHKELTEDGTFIEDTFLAMVCEDSFRKMLATSPNPDDELGRLFHETLTAEDFNEWFWFQLGNHTYFRLNENVSVDSVNDVIKLHDSKLVWHEPVFYVWFRGLLYESDKNYKDPMPIFGHR